MTKNMRYHFKTFTVLHMYEKKRENLPEISITSRFYLLLSALSYVFNVNTYVRTLRGKDCLVI